LWNDERKNGVSKRQTEGVRGGMRDRGVGKLATGGVRIETKHSGETLTRGPSKGENTTIMRLTK